MPGLLYANGRIPAHALDPVPCIGGSAWLLPIPARAFLDVVAECERRHGWSPVITSAGDGFRSYDRQARVFLERYEPRSSGGRDVRWWRGVRYIRVRGAAAAVPGTSNHGKGITVDVSGLGAFTSERYRQFRAIAERHGWSNAEGRSVREPWHWNYERTAYPVTNTNTLPGVDIDLPGGALPDPLEEDDMYTDEDRAQAARTEEHVMATRQHAANAEVNSYEAVKLLRAHLEPTRTHAARAEANAYRAVRLLEESRRDLAATEGV